MNPLREPRLSVYRRTQQSMHGIAMTILSAQPRPTAPQNLPADPPKLQIMPDAVLQPLLRTGRRILPRGTWERFENPRV